jgi:hypothetical protein
MMMMTSLILERKVRGLLEATIMKIISGGSRDSNRCESHKNRTYYLYFNSAFS